MMYTNPLILPPVSDFSGFITPVLDNVGIISIGSHYKKSYCQSMHPNYPGAGTRAYISEPGDTHYSLNTGQLRTIRPPTFIISASSQQHWKADHMVIVLPKVQCGTTQAVLKKQN